MDALGPGDPRVVGPYELLGVLGAGGMGVVYLGRGESGELAAVKVVHAAWSHDPEFRARFAREVAVLRAVQGSFTAAVLESDAQAPMPWVAMEFVAGPTVERAVQDQGPLAAPLVREFAVGLAGALEAMHRVGVIHRDLKPSNVILSAHGPVVIDLGIALVEGATVLTATGQQMGTIAWMAPEQLSGRPETVGTDMFAWACLVCLVATGRHPFGDGRPEAVGMRIMSGEPDLSGLGGLDTAVVDCVAVALAKDPDARPTAAQAIATITGYTGPPDAIINHIADEVTAVWAAPAVPVVVGQPPTVDGGAPVDASGDRGPRRKGRSARVLGVLVVTGVALGAAATWILADGTTRELVGGAPTSSSAPAAESSSVHGSDAEAAEVTLGDPGGWERESAYVVGIGAARPPSVDFGGHPTTVLRGLVWRDWGHSEARATGQGVYVGPDQSTAEGTWQEAEVIASALGTCGEGRSYTRLRWYFPQHEADSPDNLGWDLCTGEYIDPGGEVVTPQPADDLTLDAAIADAESYSCRTCVTSEMGGAEEKSASLGLITFGISDPDDGGAVSLFGFSGTEWEPLTSWQDVEILPTRLPEQVWICVDDNSTNLRSGPDEGYPVVEVVSVPTEAQATFFQLSSPQTTNQDGELVDGEGWFEVSSGSTRAWVSSRRITNQYYDNLQQGPCEWWQGR